MRNYFFCFLFLFFSACSSDSESDKSDYPFSTKTINKSFYQKKRSGFIIVQQIDTSTDANANAGVDTSTNVGADIETDVEDLKVIIQQVGINIEAGSSSGAEVVSIADADSSSRPEAILNADAGSSSRPEAILSADAGSNSRPAAIPSADAGSNSRPAAILNADAGADTYVVQKTPDKAIQKLADFDVGDNLIQEEECGGFSKADWTDQGLSIEQSIQLFIRQQMQSLLSINREFPSPKDKEDSVRCFVNTAFSLNSIFKITTDRWWENVQVPLQAPHEEILIGFIEHYFVAWVGFGLLLPIKPISSDRISFVVKEPRLLKNGQYKVITKVNIMSFYSTEILWIVDVQSFPEGLAFLDIFFEGVSSLYLLERQMYYLFQRKKGNMG